VPKKIHLCFMEQIITSLFPITPFMERVSGYTGDPFSRLETLRTQNPDIGAQIPAPLALMQIAARGTSHEDAVPLLRNDSSCVCLEFDSLK
jgi:hypothetical protein